MGVVRAGRRATVVVATIVLPIALAACSGSSTAASVGGTAPPKSASANTQGARPLPGGGARYSTGPIAGAAVDPYIAKWLRPLTVTNGWGLRCRADYVYLAAASDGGQSKLYVFRNRVDANDFGHIVTAPAGSPGLTIDKATCEVVELSTSTGARLHYSYADDRITED